MSVPTTTDWKWVDLFPGLDLSQVRELVVEISPTNFYGLWFNLANAAQNLCQDELLPRGPLRKLTLKIEDIGDCECYLWVVKACVMGEGIVSNLRIN